jgi:hypothetical protein
VPPISALLSLIDTMYRLRDLESTTERYAGDISPAILGVDNRTVRREGCLCSRRRIKVINLSPENGLQRNFFLIDSLRDAVLSPSRAMLHYCSQLLSQGDGPKNEFLRSISSFCLLQFILLCFPGYPAPETFNASVLLCSDL